MMLCRHGMRLLLERQMQLLDSGHLTAAGHLFEKYTQVVTSELGGKEDASVLPILDQHFNDVIKQYSTGALYAVQHSIHNKVFVIYCASK